MILMMFFVSLLARPDNATIAYFATIVDLCKGRDPEAEEEKGEKLARIMDILLLNQAELDECVHSTSIRNTCRKVLRKVFKEELLDPNVHFGHILQKEDVVKAIRGQYDNLRARFFYAPLRRFRPFDESLG